MKINSIEKIISYLKKGNKNKARSFVISQLDADRFESTMLISSQQADLLAIDGLFDADIEVEQLPQEEWGRNYWTQMCVELSNNFSKEKLTHIIEIMIFLREQKDPKFIVKAQAKVPGNPISTSSPCADEKINNGSVSTKVAVGAVAGGVIGAGSGAVIATKGGAVATGAVVTKGAAVGAVTTGVATAGGPSLLLKGVIFGGAIGAVVGAAVFYTLYKNNNNESIT